ncbi:MAG: hypothetical protein Fur0022_12560 [Anaerolineales bacterium]
MPFVKQAAWLIAGILGFVLWGTGCSVFPPPAWEAGVLFQEDFSVLGGKWSRVRDEAGITDYEQGGYRIQVLQPNTQFWSRPGLDVQDVHIEVEAITLAGPQENLFGVICRYQDDRNFYFFLIGDDGFFVVGKYKNGAQSFIGMETFGFHPALQTSPSVDVFQVDCVGETLTLTVNELEIVTVQDRDFLSGDVGLIAGTLDVPGTDVLFDNFVVRKP